MIPRLFTVIVYSTVWPGLTDVSSRLLTMLSSAPAVLVKTQRNFAPGRNDTSVAGGLADGAGMTIGCPRAKLIGRFAGLLLLAVSVSVQVTPVST